MPFAWSPSPCLVPAEMTKRDVPGFAIGGLSGGESKNQFWRMVALSTARLPRDKPRYLMGVGYVGERGDSATLGSGFLGTPTPKPPPRAWGRGRMEACLGGDRGQVLPLRAVPRGWGSLGVGAGCAMRA